MIAFDATIGASGTGGTSNANLVHAANVMVIVSVHYKGAPGTRTVTCGGVSMTALQLSSQGSVSKNEVFYLYVSGAATDNISVSLGIGVIHAWQAVSYTGAANLGASSFENLSSNNGTGASVQTETCTVAAGSANRMIIGCVGGMDTVAGTGSITIAPNNSETERGETDRAGTGGPTNFNAISAQIQEFSSASSHSSDTGLTHAAKSISWAVNAFGLLVAAAGPSNAVKSGMFHIFN